MPSLSRSLNGGILLVAAMVVSLGILSPGTSSTSGIGLANALIMLSMVPLTGWGGQVSLCQMTFAGLGAFAMSKMGHGGSVIGLFAALALAGRRRGADRAPGAAPPRPVPGPGHHGLRRGHGQHVLPAPGHLHLRRVGAHPPARPSSASTSTDQRLRDLPVRRVRRVVDAVLYAMRRGPIGRVLSAMKDSEAACATLGLSLTTTKLFVFALSAGLAGLAGALYGGMRTVAGSTDFLMLQSLPILLLVVVGGVATASGALMGGIALGLLPANADNVFIGAGTILLAFYADGVLPLVYSRFNAWWAGLVGPRQQAVPLAQEQRPRRPRREPGGLTPRAPFPGPSRPWMRLL